MGRRGRVTFIERITLEEEDRPKGTTDFEISRNEIGLACHLAAGEDLRVLWGRGSRTPTTLYEF